MRRNCGADQIRNCPIAERPFIKRFIYYSKDLFNKPDSAKLRKEKILNELGAYLEQTPFGLVVVNGYTGVTGDKEENLRLTQARAMVVRQYLIENFRIEDERVKTKGMGEDAAADSEKTNRVEILVYASDSKKPVDDSRRITSKITSNH